MILVIRNGFAAMRGKKISKSVFDQLPIFLAHAESRLDFALWREAYRRLGWNPRAISFELFSAPEDWADTARRFENYRRACMSLEDCARGYVEHLRAQHGLNKSELVAHGSTDACSAATHEAVGVSTRLNAGACLALMVSSDLRERPSNHEGPGSQPSQPADPAHPSRPPTPAIPAPCAEQTGRFHASESPAPTLGRILRACEPSTPPRRPRPSRRNT